MQAGAGGLADRVQALEVGSAGEVGEHAAAGVVRGGHHRNRRAGDVDPQLQTAGVDGGEVGADEVGRLVRDVQVDAVQPVALHLEVDRAGHDVARRQLGPRIMRRHEAGAIGQQQTPALATHRLGNQEVLGLRVVQAGRVELDELHVLHPAAGPPGGGDAVAGGGVGIGGVEVDLARAAGGQHRVRGAEGADLAAGLVQGVQAQAAVGRHQIDQHVPLEHGDARSARHLRQQRLLHRRAGGVGRVDDAPGAVPALAGQVQPAGFLGEAHAQGLEPGNALGRVPDDEAGGGRLGEPGTGHQGVGHMGFEAVVRGHHRGDAALGPAAGAFGQGLLGEQRHPARRREQQGGAEPGQAAADDEHVKVRRGGRCHGGGDPKWAPIVARDGPLRGRP